MPLSRRDFLKFGIASTGSLFLPTNAIAASLSARADQTLSGRKTLSIVQGATDDTRTQFSIVHNSDSEISAEVILPNGTRIATERRMPYFLYGKKTGVTQFFFSGLPSGMDLLLVVSDSNSQILDQRIFSTLNPERGIKLAVCSCMRDSNHEPGIWRDLAAQNPDALLFIGDSTYCDEEMALFGEPTPARLWRRFAEARSILEIYHMPRLIPIFAVWDDHDFGKNDSNSVDYPYVTESQNNFLTYFPMNPQYCRFLERGPGISSALSIAGQRILLLDDRSFRLPAGSRNRYAQWGKEQEEWAVQLTAEQPGTTWWMNGSQIFPSVVWKESVSGDHPSQFKGFLEQLRSTRRRVLFASGDVHYSEVSRIEPEMLGYETFEVTSSSIHSSSFPGFPGIVPNPRRILSEGKRNYVLVECGAGEQSFKVQCRSPSTVNFEIRL